LELDSKVWYNPRKISVRRSKISGYIIVVDETLVKVGSESIWLWVAIDRVQNQENSGPKYIKREKETCLLQERFIAGVVKGYGKKTSICFN
jgi:putative transposase